MNQVANQTELNKATLYSYFANKDDLIDAIVCEGLGQLDKVFQQAVLSSASGLQIVLDLTKATFSFYREHPIYFYAMNHQERRGPGAERETPFSMIGDEIASSIFGMLQESVRRGISDGSIRKGVDMGRFSIVFFAYTYGVTHTVMSKEDIYVDMLDLTVAAVEKSAMEFLQYFLEQGEKQ